jgi:hypothetical protein
MVTSDVHVNEIYENIWNFYTGQSYKHLGGDLDVWVMRLAVGFGP